VEAGGQARRACLALLREVDTSDLFDKLYDMKTNVSGLLRDFPRIRRAALAGEEVVVQTREGNLLIVAEQPPTRALFGCMKNEIAESADTIDEPTLPATEWNAAL
jgi:hypothetical protein